MMCLLAAVAVAAHRPADTPTQVRPKVIGIVVDWLVVRFGGQ
jgi:hypothetical protein